ncbi:hypothetical protein OIU76_018635 [Salix suchowensis]|nr:hypothetical protein OIU76_018635 [Salix suchowensis]
MAAEILRLLGFIVSLMIIQYTAVNGKIRHHKFVVKSAPFTRLCSAKEILTVNGKFPGPTLEAHAGDELRIAVHNRAKYNITLHWNSQFHDARDHCGEWWKKDVMKIPGDANITGGTFKVMVEQGKTYLLRIVNAVMDENLFFVIAKHKLTITSLPATISMASRAYSSAFGAGFDNTTATAVVEYHGIYQSPESPHFAPLPPYNGTQASTDFTEQFRSPVKADVPQKVDTHLLFAISVNLLNCSADKPCAGSLW